MAHKLKITQDDKHAIIQVLVRSSIKVDAAFADLTVSEKLLVEHHFSHLIAEFKDDLSDIAEGMV